MNVTIADIAKAAGVGPATVVRALQGRGYVKSETKARVLRVAAELKYRPNNIARSLITGKSGLIAVVATVNMNPMLDKVLGPVELACGARGYAMLFSSTGGTVETERVVMEQLLALRVAGAMVFPDPIYSNPEHYMELANAGVKLVVMDNPVVGLDVPQVTIDHTNSVRLATEFLVELGHRKIVLVVEPPSVYPGPERTQGFRDAIAGCGLPRSAGIVVQSTGYEQTDGEAVARLLAKPSHPTAVIARHTEGAIGVMKAAIGRGLRVPEDLSVVSNGDAFYLDWLQIPLTTLQYPYGEMVNRGIELLWRGLDNPEASIEIEAVPGRLVVRGSTGPAPKR